MLERIASKASPEVLDAALAAPTDIGGVASLLSDLAPLETDVSDLDPFAEAMARGVAIKQQLLRQAGGAFGATQVARLLGITRQAVDKRRLRQRLLAVPSGSGDYLYPACQFDDDSVLKGFEEVLTAFSIEDPWTRLSALVSKSPALRRKSIIAALKRGEFEQAVAVARSFGDQAG
jgi:hypothetical protein